MEREFIVTTVATVTYDNYCTIPKELWEEYREEYPDCTDEELARIIFYDCESMICDDSTPTRWDNEEVTQVESVAKLYEEENEQAIKEGN